MRCLTEDRTRWSATNPLLSGVLPSRGITFTPFPSRAPPPTDRDISGIFSAPSTKNPWYTESNKTRINPSTGCYNRGMVGWQ